MNQCVSMQRSWHGWEAKEKTNVYPTPNQKHPLLLLFFLLDDFFSFLSLFWKGFWQIRRKMHWQRSWHFQVRHLCRNPSARVVEEHIFQLSFQSRKQSISRKEDYTIPYHSIPIFTFCSSWLSCLLSARPKRLYRESGNFRQLFDKFALKRIQRSCLPSTTCILIFSAAENQINWFHQCTKWNLKAISISLVGHVLIS